MSRKEKYAKKSKKRLLPRILIGIVLIFLADSLAHTSIFKIILNLQELMTLMFPA